ncbi:hypothetical protein, partial [Pseudomonas aeruginosa]|uniref:hypothetical protein n=2 Tax=Pseudomonas aeruginosa TaxID=287 RepID=UPI0039694B18
MNGSAMISARIMGYSSSVAEPPACLAGGASPRLSVRGRIASSSKPRPPPAGAAQRSCDYRNLSNERHGLNYYKIQAFRLPESRKKLCNGNDLKLSKTTPAVARRHNENGRRSAGRGTTREESVSDAAGAVDGQDAHALADA